MPLAPGFEEIEVIAVVDILRRAGVKVIIASTEDNPAEGRNKVKIVADASLDSVRDEDFDMIVLPGGALGTDNLKKDKRVKEILKRLYSHNKFITAICAGPTVLSAIGITDGKRITSHPGVRAEFKKEKLSDDRVVVDGKIITSQGPGTAIEFALKLSEILVGNQKTEEINKNIVGKI